MTDLLSVPPDTFTYTAPGDYLRTRIWQVYDNYQLPWTYANFPVTEAFNEAGPNSCGLTIQTGSTVTNGDGRFQDQYGDWDGNHPILQCRIDPTCTSPFTQTITVAGVPFSHGVTYGCSDVQITRQ